MKNELDTAQALFIARNEGKLIEEKLNVSTLETAYRLQACVNELHGDQIIGWKIGATSEIALDMLKLQKPFHGPLHQQFHFEHHDHGVLSVPVSVTPATRIETEFVVALKEDLPANGEASIEDVEKCTSWLAPGLEIVGSRCSNELPTDGLLLIADSAANAATVIGTPVANWQEFDLSKHPVKLTINGKTIANGHSGQSIAANPLGMVAWLANDLATSGQVLQAGQVIYCGTCSGMTEIKPDDQIEADLGNLGKLSIRIRNKLSQ
ncbi:MAG: fumarylacetoacetate hydrolase family protein [Granulosicoccus sp.]|nr:fumarylacetoacetate hydrolase family protein [Granulosicoccus sp.]